MKPAPAAGQQDPPATAVPDTARAYELDAVVVTAERVEAPLISATAATARLSGKELRRLPLLSLSDALQQAPGLVFLNFDGLGEDPHLTIRGFYGGGEAEYVAVLLNGTPLNDAETGLFNWEMIPLSAVESIEIVRGGSSSLYGDAAIGGVINIITAGPADRGLRGTLSGGDLGVLRGSAALSTEVAGRRVRLFGSARRSDGYRDRAGRTGGTAGASISLFEGGSRALDLSFLTHARSVDEPGPLPAASLAGSRTGVMPFYRFDGTEETTHRLALDGRTTGIGPAVLSGYLVGEYRGTDAVRTLLLSPEFADTKRRRLRSTRLLGSVQGQLPAGVFRWADELLLGMDGSLGRLGSEYHSLLAGGADAYGTSLPAGELDAKGEGVRSTIAGFVRYELRPASAVRLSTGGRVDWIRDTFDPHSPSEREPSRTDHLAFSPRVGLNLRYVSGARHQGHLFANLGRSFKAPTPDQLFDQRSVPVPFPPYSVAFSNADLRPQYGTSREAGLYHRVEMLPRSLAGELSMALYQIDMRDELDFDLETLRYVNIGRSRHRGLETGIKVHGPGAASAHLTYTLQSVTNRQGELRGRYLKAIPRHFLSAGVAAAHRSGLGGSVSVSRADGIYLDDANTIPLPGFTKVDGKLSYPLGSVVLELEGFNLLDRDYSTTGFPDPAGTGVVYYYPAAGRVVQLGISASR